MAIKKDTLDQLLSGRDQKEVFSKDGLFDELKKALAERVLNAELEGHLDGEVAAGKANHRNGYSKKTVLTETSRIDIKVPRDRESTFDPKLIQRYQRRFPGFDEKIVSMYARGITVREIQGHLLDLYGLEVSPDLVSTITDAVLETVAEWQNRPLIDAPHAGSGRGLWLRPHARLADGARRRTAYPNSRSRASDEGLFYARRFHVRRGGECVRMSHRQAPSEQRSGARRWNHAVSRQYERLPGLRLESPLHEKFKAHRDAQSLRG
jgi:Transposase, Mutator family